MANMAPGATALKLTDILDRCDLAGVVLLNLDAKALCACELLSRLVRRRLDSDGVAARVWRDAHACVRAAPARRTR